MCSRPSTHVLVDDISHNQRTHTPVQWNDCGSRRFVRNANVERLAQGRCDAMRCDDDTTVEKVITLALVHDIVRGMFL